MESKEKIIKTKNIKDVLKGVLFLLIGLIFFVASTFWIITSKLYPPKKEDLKNYPDIIQFFINDKTYCLILMFYIPFLTILLTMRKFTQYCFRHS